MERAGDATAGGSRFEEVQYPAWPWVALALGGSALGGFAAPLGWVGRLGAAGITAVAAAAIMRLLGAPLRVTVEPDAVEARFGELTRFRIPVGDIVAASACTYRPLLDYGGWGIRFGRGGRAYSMVGDQGVQLVMRDGSRILIGSQRPEALAGAICRAAGLDDSIPF